MRLERFRCLLCDYILVRVLPRFYGMRCPYCLNKNQWGCEYCESEYLSSTVCPLCKEECSHESF